MRRAPILALFAALAACHTPVAVDPDSEPCLCQVDYGFGCIDRYIDADPVAARSRQWGPVRAIESPFPWPDRLQETEPDFIHGPVTPAAASAPDLSDRIIDPDPVRARNKR